MSDYNTTTGEVEHHQPKATYEIPNMPDFELRLIEEFVREHVPVVYRVPHVKFMELVSEHKVGTKERNMSFRELYVQSVNNYINNAPNQAARYFAEKFLTIDWKERANVLTAHWKVLAYQMFHAHKQMTAMENVKGMHEVIEYLNN